MKFNFFRGNQRSVKAKKNIFLSLFVKVLSITISLFLVPMTLGYLNAYEYGVWLTLSSILMWINYLDIGLGNGLRNKLAEALALGDTKKGQIYVSTTFFLLTGLMCAIYLIYYLSQLFFDWRQILNVSSSNISANLNSLVSLVFAFFCITFILKFIGNIYLAKQLSVVNDLFILSGNIISAITIYILTLTTKGDISKVAIVFSAAPIIVYIIAFPITFWGEYRCLMPRLSAVKLEYAKELMGLGVQFFIIQIACLLVFATSNILIAQLCGPEEVTPYNIAFKYFSVITMGFTIIITPFWSAATDAFVKNDYLWIKESIRNMIFVWLTFFAITIVLILVSNWVYYLWVGMKIPFSLSLLMGIYVSISNWNSLFAYFINGIGKVRLQLYCSIVTGIIFIPLALVLGRNLGVCGIVLAMCLVLSISAFFLPYQYQKIMNRKAIGVWRK